MSNGPIECDSCGAVMRESNTADWYCPNEECTKSVPQLKEFHTVHSKMPPVPWITGAEEEDVVYTPSHYSLFGNIEVIDAIKELLTEEEFRGYLKGNVLKYRLRAGKKDNVEQDIAKAMRYEAWLSD